MVDQPRSRRGWRVLLLGRAHIPVLLTRGGLPLVALAGCGADVEDAGASVYRLVRSAGGDASRVKLRIHHSSVLFRCRPPWVCFFSCQQNDSGW